MSKTEVVETVSDITHEVCSIPAQTVLPFKLDSTDETLTAQGGLALFGEYCRELGLTRWLDKELPTPSSGMEYAPSACALSLIVMLHGGGQSLEETRKLRAEAVTLNLPPNAVPRISRQFRPAMPSEIRYGGWEKAPV